MRKLRKALVGLALLAQLGLTWAVAVYHLGVFPVPPLGEPRPAPAQWIPKSELGMHQLILSGDPHSRGLAAGKYVRELLYMQERDLITQLDRVFPYPVARRVLEVLAIRWFWGIDRFFEPWSTAEMYGVSKSAPREFDYLGDPFTRQIAYHGLHEVGQMMVDQGSEAMGCTVVAVPHRGSWVLGRNFDFEGGRVFDSEKIMKWVFPDEGYAFLSVTWAGMVGAVTGVNEHGLYLSLNAAGSRDFRRHGTPSTLVLLKALQFSRTAEEALKILREEIMFITDIFVLLDSRSGKLFRVEKSPDHTEVIELESPSIVTNHLISPRWKDDPVNLFRRNELTSLARSERGEALLASLDKKALEDPRQAEASVLRILRDKGEANGRPLHLGNRRAIDALIATHVVLLNGPEQILYVSRGPGVSGPLVGFDLRASFKARRPVVKGGLPRDPIVSDPLFTDVRAAIRNASRAGAANCADANRLLEAASIAYRENHVYYDALGDHLQRCERDPEGARRAWKHALELSPAYPAQLERIQAKLRGGVS